jgi:2-aminoadipate transaminase
VNDSVRQQPSGHGWNLARRADRMNPSVIREILKVTEQPGIISLAGGLPSPLTFPVREVAEATARVLSRDGAAALQYAASEGHGPLRDWVAAHLGQQGLKVDAAQILITTGSQQGLDLAAKVLIDQGSRILVETPTYLGALQAFTPMEPQVQGVDSDDEGVLPDDLERKAVRARFVYLLPNFQNPTGRSMSEARRQAVSGLAQRIGLPILEDNPYGDLWFDTAPPPSLASRNPDGCLYLGSFSKVLAPGLRLGYLAAPKALYPKLLQAKQAADLHTPSLNQRIVAEVLQDGFLARHVPTIRALYKSQRDAMLAALAREFGQGGARQVQWNRPGGGMFLWLRLPAGIDATDLLPRAVAKGVAFVPGAAFYADNADPRSLRLSFTTASAAQIDAGIQALAQALRETAA